tara:strand:+ start:808 stop:996 length:189 start_codon:yes stop_codon:yes gene_type:complete
MGTFILILTLHSIGMKDGIGGVTSLEIHGGITRCEVIGKEWLERNKGNRYREDKSFYMCIPK